MNHHPTLPTFGEIVPGEGGRLGAIMRGGIVNGTRQPDYAIIVPDLPTIALPWGKNEVSIHTRPRGRVMLHPVNNLNHLHKNHVLREPPCMRSASTKVAQHNYRQVVKNQQVMECANPPGICPPLRVRAKAILTRSEKISVHSTSGPSKSVALKCPYSLTSAPLVPGMRYSLRQS